MATPENITILARRELYRGRVFDIVEDSIQLPSGMLQDIAIVRHPGAVAIAAIDDDGELLLVRQYRHAIGDWLTEIPAGRLEPDETPEAAARRELEEETGYSAREWSVLTEFFAAPGFCSERIYVFLARGLSAVPSGGRPCDDDEELEVTRQAPARIIENGCHDAKTLIAAAAVLRLRG